MNRKNCISGIACAVFFLFFLYLDTQMGEESSYWPGIICKLGLALSLLSAGLSGLKWRAEVGEKLIPFSGRQAKRLLLALFLLILWGFCLNLAGFLVSSAGFMILIGLLYEPVRTKKNLIRDGIAAVMFAVGMFALFSALGISFPRGFLV